MLAAVLSVLTIFLIIAAGFFLARRKFFTPATGEVFMKTLSETPVRGMAPAGLP